jgi:heme-degrading monooxygenase HmoA
MVVEYIRYKIDPSRNDEFDQAYRRAGTLLDASPHCQRWEAARCVDDPEKQIVRIEWDSTEGASAGLPAKRRLQTLRRSYAAVLQ